MISIPIKLHTPDAVVTETEGLIKVDQGLLVLEYETKDAFFGSFKSQVKVVEILPDDVAAVTFSRGIFKTELAIRARSLKTFEQVPGAKNGEVRLRFKRQHRSEAEELADFLQRRLQELAEAPDEETTEESFDWLEH
jgi:hypothetical protein